jgi:hypothetical protein
MVSGLSFAEMVSGLSFGQTDSTFAFNQSASLLHGVAAAFDEQSIIELTEKRNMR